MPNQQKHSNKRDGWAIALPPYQKLPAHYSAWVMPLILSCIMSAVVSMVNMIKNLGWVDGFFTLWWHAWLWSWLVAYPVVLLILPLVRKITGLLVDVPPPPQA